MFSTYAALFRAPGAAAFSSAGFLARMPISMLGIGTVLMVSATTGTYAIAGILSGAMTLAGALAQPQIARLVDRFGQATVVRPALCVFAVALAGLISAVRLDWPVWSWFGFGMVAGSTLPSVGSMVRARWTHALPDPARRGTAFAFESVLDEVIFVVGPPLATLLATAVNPAAGLVVALCFAVLGGFLFTSLRRTEPPVDRHADVVPRGDVFTRGLFAVCLTFLGAGMVFGSVEVVVVAFADEQGQKNLAGLVLACYAAGSLLAGLWFGARAWRGRQSDRLAICAVCFGVATSLPLLASSIPALAAVVFVTGLSIAPVLITGMVLVERLVPRAALTEGLTWATTALTVGVTAGAAIVGPLIDTYGASTAFRLPAAAALLTAVLALVGLPWLRAARSADDIAAARAAAFVEPSDDADPTWTECHVPGASTAESVERGARGKMRA